MTATARTAWARHVVQLEAARTFIEACREESIPVLPVKGLVAAFTLYDNPSERTMTDVDIRIRPPDFARLERLARRQHWRLVEKRTVYRHLVFEVGGVYIDAECGMGPPHVSTLTIEQLIANARSSNLLGFRALIPDFSDHVVLQMVNLFKDKIVRALEWTIRDLERIPLHPDFNAQRIVMRLQANRTMALGWIVADYAVRDLGISRWGEVRDALGPLRRPLYARAVRFARARPASLLAVVLARAASDAPIERVRATMTMARWSLEKRRPK